MATLDELITGASSIANKSIPTNYNELIPVNFAVEGFIVGAPPGETRSRPGGYHPHDGIFRDDDGALVASVTAREEPSDETSKFEHSNFYSIIHD